MAFKIQLEFIADVSEEEAWDIAENLEKAAVARGYFSVTGWAEDRSRNRPEDLSGSAERVERSSGEVTTVGGLAVTRPSST